jgi:hypothetical protein
MNNRILGSTERRRQAFLKKVAIPKGCTHIPNDPKTEPVFLSEEVIEMRVRADRGYDYIAGSKDANRLEFIIQQRTNIVGHDVEARFIGQEPTDLLVRSVGAVTPRMTLVGVKGVISNPCHDAEPARGMTDSWRDSGVAPGNRSLSVSV